MALANGQHQFTCLDPGRFSLDLPLAADGTVTLYNFVSGPASFRVTFLPDTLLTPFRIELIPFKATQKLLGGRLFTYTILITWENILALTGMIDNLDSSTGISYGVNGADNADNLEYGGYFPEDDLYSILMEGLLFDKL